MCRISFSPLKFRNCILSFFPRNPTLATNLNKGPKNEYRFGVEDEIMLTIKGIGIDKFEGVLDMHIRDIGGFDIKIHNKKWEIEILCSQYEKHIILHDKIQKIRYFYEHPNEDKEVKDRFLEYYRNLCRKNGFRIKK